MSPAISLGVDALARAEEVDQGNAVFYNRFPYPWPPLCVERPINPSAWRTLVCFAVGDWEMQRLPPHPAIWVAGCGTNQAVLTALRFPTATVIASDISTSALETGSALARQFDVNNIEFRHESLNSVRYNESFDYIICTGVIHHTADPAAALSRIASALKRDGLLELMVFNRHHRVVTDAVRRALALIAPANVGGIEVALMVARSILKEAEVGRMPVEELRVLAAAPDVQIADTLLQPVEESYTVDTLNTLVNGCGVELLTGTFTQADRFNTHWWEYEFADPQLQARYECLPDVARWCVTNLLLRDRSPMLWFYCHRKDSTIRRQKERELAQGFLEQTLRAATSGTRRYVLNENGRYRAMPIQPASEPGESPTAKAVLRAMIEPARVRDAFERAGVATNFLTANDVRLRLATPACPYIEPYKCTQQMKI
jgi:SAM-dependent methyltransferase